MYSTLNLKSTKNVVNKNTMKRITVYWLRDCITEPSCLD